MPDFVTHNPLISDFDPISSTFDAQLEESAAHRSDLAIDCLDNLCLYRSSVTRPAVCARIERNDCLEALVAHMFASLPAFAAKDIKLSRGIISETTIVNSRSRRKYSFRRLRNCGSCGHHGCEEGKRLTVSITSCQLLDGLEVAFFLLDGLLVRDSPNKQGRLNLLCSSNGKPSWSEVREQKLVDFASVNKRHFRQTKQLTV